MSPVLSHLCVIVFILCQHDFVSSDESCQSCGDKIPLEMAIRMNTITDEKQLFREFIKPDVEKPVIKVAKFPLSFGFGPDSVSDGVPKPSEEEPVERKAVVKPKPAQCIPELKTISLRETEDPWIYYWPECTRLEQCGGCCIHKQLSCQPIETETVNFQVTVLEYAGNQMIYKGKEIISREKHTKCKCDCIVKEKDCNERQEYRKSECRCFCTNKDAEAKCNDDPKKHWNPDSCSCECLSVVECSSGTYYDPSSCSCEPLPTEVSTNNSEITQPPTRRRWQPNYSFFG
ncbi:vascular endothelial growth factor A-like [Macrosteles quadrilineatus]|uniref:vascular endothelial growth factor A-like n=1 Tax=Macrosteles quadrilineatus TaxID=74068 RepID=UPI0023E30917|nr:vascular endothelial growth factor A-like [Macrosteles quadrilineatus]